MSDFSEPPVETVVGDDIVTIHRAPRYFRFFAVGAIAGLVVAVILTLAFSGSQGFNLAQIFGFLALVFVVVGIGAGAVVALLIERSTRKTARTITVERLEGNGEE